MVDPVVVRQQQGRAQQEIISISSEFRGPIPPSQFFAEYEQVLPGSGNRIIAMAENQAVHRMEMEKLAINAEIEDSKRERSERGRGQYLAFGVCATALVAGATVAIYGQPWAGAGIGIVGSMTSVISAFISGKDGKTDDESAGDEGKKKPKG